MSDVQKVAGRIFLTAFTILILAGSIPIAGILYATTDLGLFPIAISLSTLIFFFRSN